MSEKQAAPLGSLIYGLDDTPPPGPALLAAIQHILASIVGIVTPSLVIGGVLGLGAEVPYLIAMSLFVSGVAAVFIAAAAALAIRQRAIFFILRLRFASLRARS